MKNITILTLALLLTQLSFAQNSFRFGLKGASNFGWLSGTDKTIEKTKKFPNIKYCKVENYRPGESLNIGIRINLFISF